MSLPLTRTRRALASAALLAAIASIGALVARPEAAEAGPKASKVWRTVAKRLRSAAKADAKASYFHALARAAGLPSTSARKAAERTAKEEFKDERSLANEQYAARLELALALDEDQLFTATIDPNDFVVGVDNPFFPLTPGTTLTYRGNTEDGVETIVVTTLAETKTILGVECTVVRDTVSLDGEVIEDTLDWYAQDKTGNVWYFGEVAMNYEDGELVDLEGSWLSGRDGAQPGIIMPANPAVGDLNRQEFLLGEAEDWGEVLSLTESVTVPFGMYTNCLQTLDGTPIEPEAQEHKYYAAGVGVVLEVSLETDERVELINVTVN